MNVRVRYGKLELDAGWEGPRSMPLTAPLDDLLGLLRPDGRGTEYRTYLEARYGTPAALLGSTQPSARSVAALIEEAARRAETGHLELAPRLAKHLAAVRFSFSGMSSQVPDDDFIALAMWSLIVILLGDPFRVITCPTCNGPWLAPIDGPIHCLRPAPGRRSRSCRALEHDRSTQARSGYAEYRREYKRIDDARRRGALDEAAVAAWRAANSAEKWTQFDDWKAAKRTGRPEHVAEEKKRR